MKHLFLVLSVLFLGVCALAQVAPVASPVVPVVAVASSEVGFVQFLVLHQGLIAGALVAILDLVMALIPGLASNGILHAVYLFIKGIASKSATPPAAS